MPVELGKPVRKHRLLTAETPSNVKELRGPFWVNCPKDGLQTVEKARQCGREESVIMAEGSTSDWFLNGLYTSSECPKCGMTLKVSRTKPHIKKDKS